MNTSLVITIDTEPDDQWEPPGPDGRLAKFRFENTRGLARLADFFHSHDVPVTWLTSWSVVEDPLSAAALKEARAEGDEIGGHLHGWETPPFLEIDHYHKSFIYEYEEEVRWKKHQELMASHERVFGARPVSYRAGRWGIDEIEYAHLERLGYQIDTSIPPGVDFRDRFGRKAPGPDFRAAMRPGGLRPYKVGNLWEVPASITQVGALRKGNMAHSLARTAAYRRHPLTPAKALTRVLEGTGLQRRVWLRPLKHPGPLLVKAARVLLEKEVPIINIMFHSSEAYVDTSPLSRTREDVERLYQDLEAVILTLKQSGKVKGRTLKDAMDHYQNINSIPDNAGIPAHH